MNLPNDVARCSGLTPKPEISDEWLGACIHRETCKRFLQGKKDAENPDTKHRIPYFMHCLVDGEYTMRIEQCRG